VVVVDDEHEMVSAGCRVGECSGAWSRPSRGSVAHGPSYEDGHKVGDRPGLAILEDLEALRSEIRDGTVLPVCHDHVQLHHVRLDTDPGDATVRFLRARWRAGGRLGPGREQS
jgi:hypothetical protein